KRINNNNDNEFPDWEPEFSAEAIEAAEEAERRYQAANGGDAVADPTARAAQAQQQAGQQRDAAPQAQEMQPAQQADSFFDDWSPEFQRQVLEAVERAEAQFNRQADTARSDPVGNEDQMDIETWPEDVEREVFTWADQAEAHYAARQGRGLSEDWSPEFERQVLEATERAETQANRQADTSRSDPAGDEDPMDIETWTEDTDPPDFTYDPRQNDRDRDGR
ncbi:MAG: hypothetical protein AAF940_05030, partial [Pseudomonadota bacterium]